MSYPYEISVRDKSAVVYDFCAIDTATDIIVSFDYVCSGISIVGNHGFSLFFTENISYPVGGGPGPGLGVTALTAITAGELKIYPGVEDSILAIGFDISGLFGSTEGGLDSDSNIIPNSIAIRGGKAQDFKLLYKTPALTSTTFDEPLSLYNESVSSVKTFRARITNGGKTLVLDHKKNKKFYNIFTYNLPFELPKCIYPSIGYSSGSEPITLKISNFHENGIFLSPTPTPTPTATPVRF